MAKIRILSPAEREAFQSPPVFSLSEKANFFAINSTVKKILESIRSPYRKVGFVLLFGYFRHAGRFFNPQKFHQQDLIFVSKLLNICLNTSNLEKYEKHPLLQDQQKTMEILGFKKFDSYVAGQSLLSEEIVRLVELSSNFVYGINFH